MDDKQLPTADSTVVTIEDLVAQKNQAISPKADGPKTVMLSPYQNYLKTQWEYTHPGERAPIYLNEKGEPVWINRKRRRHLESIDRRKLKKQLRAQAFALQANPSSTTKEEEKNT